MIDHFVNVLLEKKAENLKVYACENYPLFVDAVIVCQVSTSVHLRALKAAVETCWVGLKKNQKVAELRVSGELNSGWLIIDLNDFVIHIMLDSLREYYELDAWIEGYAT